MERDLSVLRRQVRPVLPRSDNNIKNRFYSIIRKAIRKMCRYVKIKTTSMNVYTIKPSTLSQVFMLASGQPQQNTQGYNSAELG